jgi:hypothetical protein
VLKLIGLVALVVAGLVAWVVVPIARTSSSGSWCDRAHRYEYEQRLTHDGELPWAAGMRVGLVGCAKAHTPR